jgi:hypothetical protein
MEPTPAPVAPAEANYYAPAPGAVPQATAPAPAHVHGVHVKHGVSEGAIAAMVIGTLLFGLIGFAFGWQARSAAQRFGAGGGSMMGYVHQGVPGYGQGGQDYGYGQDPSQGYGYGQGGQGYGQGQGQGYGYGSGGGMHRRGGVGLSAPAPTTPAVPTDPSAPSTWGPNGDPTLPNQ